MSADRTTLPGLKAGHQIITPPCRQNRGVTPAFLEAAERLRAAYDNYARSPANAGVSWHLVLIRDDPADHGAVDVAGHCTATHRASEDEPLPAPPVIGEGEP